LKDVFVTVACHSDYPGIVWNDFILFAQESELLDNQLTTNVLEA